MQSICIPSTIRWLLAIESHNNSFCGITGVPMKWVNQTHLAMVGRPHPWRKEEKFSSQFGENEILMWKHAKIASYRPSSAPGVLMERFNQNHLTIPGRYHPIGAILMKRKKVIEQMLRNLRFSVKLGKNNPLGVLLGSLEWCNKIDICTEFSKYPIVVIFEREIEILIEMLLQCKLANEGRACRNSLMYTRGAQNWEILNSGIKKYSQL